MPAASVPATTTVCRSRAATIWPAQVVWRRALCFFSLASILALPTRFSSAGVGQATTGLQDGVVPRPGPQDGLQGGVDLGVQAPDAALGLVDLLGQVQVEPGRHAQRRRVLVVGVARGQVGDAPHGQSGQVAHGDAHGPGHRHRQGPDGGGLIHHHQQAAVLSQALVQVPQSILAVGQGLVEQALAAGGQGGGPVIGLAYVDTDEDVHRACSMVCVSPDGRTDTD